MPADHPYLELANWDGKFSQTRTASSTSRYNPMNQALDVNKSVGMLRADQGAQQSTSATNMPPPIIPQTPTHGIAQWRPGSELGSARSDHSESAMLSSDSAYPDSEEERRRVTSMLWPEESSPPSPSRPVHYWNVPADVISSSRSMGVAGRDGGLPDSSPLSYSLPTQPSIPVPYRGYYSATPQSLPSSPERGPHHDVFTYNPISPIRSLQQRSSLPTNYSGKPGPGSASPYSNATREPHLQSIPKPDVMPVPEINHVVDGVSGMGHVPAASGSDPRISISQWSESSVFSTAAPLSGPSNVDDTGRKMPTSPQKVTDTHDGMKVDMLSTSQTVPAAPVKAAPTSLQSSSDCQPSAFFSEYHKHDARLIGDKLDQFTPVAGHTSAGANLRRNTEELPDPMSPASSDVGKTVATERHGSVVISYQSRTFTFTQLSNVVRYPSLATSTLERVNVNYVSIDGIILTTVVQELSVVPETPQQSPSPSVTPSRADSIYHSSPQVLPAIKEATQPTGAMSGDELKRPSEDLRAGSLDESTLVDPQITNLPAESSKPRQLLPGTPVRTVDELDEVPSSPLTSLDTPLAQRISKKIQLPAYALPHAIMYVDVPSFPLGRSREDYHPISFYETKPRTHIPQTYLTPGIAHKRKRSEGASGTPSGRPPVAKKKRRHHDDDDLRRFRQEARSEIQLDSLGPRAHDVLQPFCEHFDVQVDTHELDDIETRIPDLILLDTMLRGALRSYLRAGSEQVSVDGIPREALSQNSSTSPARQVRVPSKLPHHRRPPLGQPQRSQVLESMGNVPGHLDPSINHGHIAGWKTFVDHRTMSAASANGFSQQDSSQIMLETAVRGHDAFLGVNADETDPEGAPWSSSLFLASGNLSMAMSDMPSPFAPDEAPLSFLDNGTINPSLLGPPNVTSHFRTPSPSPDPPLSRVIWQSGSFFEDLEATSPPPMGRFKDTKGKGKGHAHDVGIRARESQAQSILVPPSAPGKRIRKLTAKARDSVFSMDSHRDIVRGSASRSVDELQSSEEEDTWSHRPKPRVKLEKHNLKPKPRRGKIPGDDNNRTCHQCRRITDYDKMWCAAVRPNGVLCDLPFCQPCMIKRYPDIPFDPDIPDWECPKCAGFCNCTACCQKRGETYVSTRHVVTDVELARRAPRRGPKANPRRTSRRSESSEEPVIIPQPMAAGQIWGTVYALSGREPMGVGVVADSNTQGIVLTTGSRPRPKSKSAWKRVRTFIGQSRATWTTTEVSDEENAPAGRVYIGKRGPLFDQSYRSFDQLICFDGSLTPPSNREDDEEDGPNLESPARPLDTAQLSFALANLLS
ncbi:hypothetical protein BDW22DRAFT_1419339 [Trametopsis cervina]|nr:hypothetical protein BDW22DRAFT_1419339 [Trametopsis cervina]